MSIEDEKLVTDSKEYPKLIMQGSYMDGLDIDLVEWCGLPPLTDKEYDKVWNEISDIQIIKNCFYADVEEIEGPDIPRMSDTYVYVTVFTDKEHDKLKEEVRECLIDLRDS